MSVRIAVVGLGKIARDQHLPVLGRHPAFSVVAAASPHSRLDDVPTFSSVADLLASDIAFDAVSMCQPPQVRFGAALQAIEAGKHVFLEKPPGALSEVDILVEAAAARGVSLFAAWHSRCASGVETARAWIAERTVVSVKIDWREDVRVWHPGQTWIWQAGGFGVFDPGINALSIATAILPRPLVLAAAWMQVPSNVQAPIAARLEMRDTAGAAVIAEFDFLQTGPQTWDIRVVTDRGVLVLSKGGSELLIDGAIQRTEPEAEYRGLYDRFAALIEAGQSDVDIRPLQLVADAFLVGERGAVEPFIE